MTARTHTSSILVIYGNLQIETKTNRAHSERRNNNLQTEIVSDSGILDTELLKGHKIPNIQKAL